MSEVEITLNGKTETLRCTLKAGKIVNGINGGFNGALMRLGAMDLDAHVMVTAAGLGKKPVEIEEAVYKTGLPNLTEALTNYVLLLANGGRPFASTEGGGSGEA